MRDDVVRTIEEIRASTAALRAVDARIAEKVAEAAARQAPFQMRNRAARIAGRRTV